MPTPSNRLMCSAPCTPLISGLGRAPASALAYMYWLRGWQLPEAVEALTSQRRCSPRIEAIRAATADLLTDSHAVDVTISLRQRGTLKTAQVRLQARNMGLHTHLRSLMVMVTAVHEIPH